MPPTRELVRKYFKLSAIIALLLLLAIPVFSHDYWFQPESFFAPVGSIIPVHLYVGDESKIEEERPLQKDRTVSLQLFSVRQTPVDLMAQGQDTQSPLVRLSFTSEGNHLLAMERKAATIKLDAKKFTNYLTEEGLDSVVSLRKEANESGKEGRERYCRYLKALFQVGNQHDETYKLVLGQRLEILPQSNPYGMKLGETLQVRILFEGKPLAEAKVFAYNGSFNQQDKVYQQAARTAKDGSVSFKLDRSGEWLIRLVHMRRCVTDCAEIDWESYWGAYSFGMK